jgi:hypothetical protein
VPESEPPVPLDPLLLLHAAKAKATAAVASPRTSERFMVVPPLWLGQSDYTGDLRAQRSRKGSCRGCRPSPSWGDPAH